MTQSGAPPVETRPTPRMLIEQAMADSGEPLAQFVAARRESGRSWRLIAIEISTRTGIDISNEALRGWFS